MTILIILILFVVAAVVLIELFIFILFVIAAVVLIELRERKRAKKYDKTGEKETVMQTNTNCCGAHLVCEQDLLSNPVTEIIYYDDEELDKYKGISSDAYSETEIQQFAEVFYTLQEHDVVGWLRSLQARSIELPDKLKDEALMIVREQRNKP